VNLLEAIVLGVVQGLTEFLPVSSSGHLAVVEFAFQKFGVAGAGVFREEIIFDVTVHLASAIAAFAFFFSKIVALFRAGNRRALLLIVFASIPAGLAGVALKKLEIIEGIKSGVPVPIAVGFLLTAVILKLTDFAKDKGIELRSSGFGRALAVGLGQAVAIMPGVSRSGATISTGLLAGFKRAEAVEFSFFLAIPAIVGANLLEIALKLSKGEVITGNVGAVPIAAGFVASLVVSLVCIKVLIVLVRRGLFSKFAYYCAAAAAATAALILI
jgi:undecaprenyl-diphosphatase